MKLRIADDLVLPVDVVTQTVAVLANGARASPTRCAGLPNKCTSPDGFVRISGPNAAPLTRMSVP